MPFDGNRWNWDKMVSKKEILDLVKSFYGDNNIVKLKDGKNDTTSSYRLFDSVGSFGIISSMTNPFCDSCNRIRLTADGKVRNCLFSNSEVDLLQSLRKNKNIKSLIVDAILNKHKQQGGLSKFKSSTFKVNDDRSMVSIGG